MKACRSQHYAPKSNMTATNHFLIGVGVSLIIKQPLLALPISFASHLVADSLPHYGGGLSLTKVKYVWIFDALCLSIALLFCWHYLGFYSVFVGFIATSPDLAWVYKFIIQEKRGQLPPRPKSGFNKFHSIIQKYEKPYNWPFEFVYLALSLLFIRSMS